MIQVYQSIPLVIHGPHPHILNDDFPYNQVRYSILTFLDSSAVNPRAPGAGHPLSV